MVEQQFKAWTHELQREARGVRTVTKYCSHRYEAPSPTTPQCSKVIDRRIEHWAAIPTLNHIHMQAHDTQGSV